MRAFWTNLEIVLQNLRLQDFPATRAFNPKTFWNFGRALGNLTFNPRCLEIVEPRHNVVAGL